MRIITPLGYALLVVGLVVLIAPTGAFETLVADRGIGVETAADEGEAFLGLEEDYDSEDPIVYEGGWRGTDESAVVAAVTNNVDGDWTDVRVTVDAVRWANKADAGVLRVADAPDALSPGETAAVELECSRDVTGSANDATIELDVGVGGEETPVSVERSSFTVTGVEFDCEGTNDAGTEPPDEQVSIGETPLEIVETPTAEPGEWVFGSQPDSRVEFNLQNTGDESVTVTAIQLRETSSDASRVESIVGGNSEIEIDANADGWLDATEGIGIGSTSHPLDQNATLDPGISATVTVQEFRETGPFTRVDMAGEDLLVVLTVEGLDPSDPDAAVGVEIPLTDLQ